MSKGIQSIDLGFKLLKAVAEADRPLTLSELAERVSMTSSKARNYLVSFLRTGLIAQVEQNGNYKLGPYAFRLGLAAISKFDMMEHCYAAMDELTNRTGVATLLVVWTVDGPKVIAHRNGQTSLPVYFRIGTTPGLSYTATGQTFLAYLPQEQTREFLDKEFKANQKHPKFKHITKVNLEKTVDEIRGKGIARAEQIILPDVSFEGFSAISAPVFDHQNRIVSVLTAVFERTRSAKFVKSVEKSIKEITANTSQQAGSQRLD
jgi:DNA-binding IclR family transcriptional regulator